MAINHPLSKYRVALIGINGRQPPAPLCVRKVQSSSAGSTAADATSAARTCCLQGRAAPTPPGAKPEGQQLVETAALP